MPTIKITITSSTPTQIVMREDATEKRSVKAELGLLLKKLHWGK